MEKFNIFWSEKVKTYIFKVELEEEDGIWQAVVPALPGCNAWGKTIKDALIAIQENTRAYIETLIEQNRPIPVERKAVKIPIHTIALC